MRWDIKGQRDLEKTTGKGISLKKLFRMFPDDETARMWFEKARWPDGRMVRNVRIAALITFS